MMKRNKEITLVTLAGSAGNLALVAFKFAAGIIGKSSAMVADAVHSLSDLLTDVVVLVFVAVSSQPQDSSHDYGHGKFETLAAFIISLALAGAAIGIIVSGCRKFIFWLDGGQINQPGMLALWAALVSIAVKVAIYLYTIMEGRKLDSPAVKANAIHHLSDALSSVGAALGIGGAILFGERWAVLDPLASIVIGAILMKVAWDLLKSSVGELTDQSLPKETESEILEILCGIPEISEPHKLRTRRVGNRIVVEAHVRMDGDMSLNAAHEAASSAEEAIKGRFGDNSLVTIHMEPR